MRDRVDIQAPTALKKKILSILAKDSLKIEIEPLPQRALSHEN